MAALAGKGEPDTHDQIQQVLSPAPVVNAGDEIREVVVFLAFKRIRNPTAPSPKP
ncbi:MAG: hypothetical protein HC889_19110 [Synechococcaceae cyanobacterium SM1_2_3]|nr:hypothetical protein [Synechococcaceae cyanobacterium SM1_2_3]